MPRLGTREIHRLYVLDHSPYWKFADVVDFVDVQVIDNYSSHR
jgi:hypothetical protein